MIREHLDHVLDDLPEDQIREILDFARFLRAHRERQEWQDAAIARFAEAYGPDEPEYSETQVKPELAE